MTDKDREKKVTALKAEYVPAKRKLDTVLAGFKALGEKPPKLCDLSVITDEIKAAVTEALKDGPVSMKGLDKAICETPVIGYKDANELKEIHDALKEMGMIQIAHRFEGGVAARVELVPKG